MDNNNTFQNKDNPNEIPIFQNDDYSQARPNQTIDENITSNQNPVSEDGEIELDPTFVEFSEENDSDNINTSNDSYDDCSEKPIDPIAPIMPRIEKTTYKPIEISKSDKGIKVFAFIIAFLILISACVTGGYYLGISSNKSTTPKVDLASKPKSENALTASQVYNAVSPSVVGIYVYNSDEGIASTATGVFYSEDGYIITNYHVIADAISNSGGKIEVFLDSDTEKSHTAQVVGYNISTDLAVIKIDAKGLQKAEIGNSDELKLGQYVITVGNPGGLEFMDSVTYGVISGLDRIVSSDSDLKLIQTDAAINPGNSGGALVNAKGQLVGINSSKIVSEEYEGMGFAIPVKKVIEVCDGIIERENAPEPYVGISISERYTADVLSFYGYPTGAVVLSVAETSPAENAGIRRGDIITKFKGTTLNSYEMFEQLLSECSPGEKVNAEIYRSGKYYSTEITIGSNS